MKRRCFHVRPHVNTDGSGACWVVDVYDLRGGWESTSGGNGSMSKADAQKRAAQLRRLSVSTLFNGPPLNRCRHQLGNGLQCMRRVTLPQTLCGQHGG